MYLAANFTDSKILMPPESIESSFNPCPVLTNNGFTHAAIPHSISDTLSPIIQEDSKSKFNNSLA